MQQWHRLRLGSITDSLVMLDKQHSMVNASLLVKNTLVCRHCTEGLGRSIDCNKQQHRSYAIPLLFTLVSCVQAWQRGWAAA